MTVPHQQAGWTFGLEALYLDPSSPAFNYGTVLQGSGGRANSSYLTTGQTAHVDPSFDLGFALFGRYHFANGGNDVTLRYERFDSTDSDSASANGDHNYITPVFRQYYYGHPPYQHARGKSSIDYQALDLLFGQHIDIGKKLDLHIAAGLRAVDFDNSFEGHYYGSGSYANQPEYKYEWHAKAKTEFLGVGPRLLMTGTYNISQYIAAVAQLGGSLLIGQAENKLREQDMYSGPKNSPNTHTVEINKKENDHVVPELDSRLGLQYNYMFRNASTLSVFAGWTVTHYFNVSNLSQFMVSSPSHMDDIAMNGPYMGVSYRTA